MCHESLEWLICVCERDLNLYTLALQYFAGYLCVCVCVCVRERERCAAIIPIYMSHVTHTNESCLTYEWVMPHVRMSHFIHIHESCHKYEWTMPYICAAIISICVIWLFAMCDMTHSYVWHDSFLYVTWLIFMCDMTRSYVWHDSFLCEPWLIPMCDMTRSYMWHDSFLCAIWLVPMCDMTHFCHT